MNGRAPFAAVKAILSDGVDLNFKEIDPGVLDKFLTELPDKALRLGLRVALAVLCWVIGVQLIRILRKIVRHSLERAGAEKGVRQFLDSCLKAVLYCVLIFFLLSGFGLDAASVVAVVGSLGLTVGLALQGSLSNFAGGVLILLVKPFVVGDYIIENAKGNEGAVLEIQLFYTKLATADNRVVVVPNGTLANTPLVNVTNQQVRRLDIRVGISYQADIDLAKALLLCLMQEDEQVEKDREMLAFVEELGESAVILGCRFWVRTENYFPVKWRMTEQIKKRFDENGIDIPFPQMDVTVKRIEIEKQ